MESVLVSLPEGCVMHSTSDGYGGDNLNGIWTILTYNKIHNIMGKSRSTSLEKKNGKAIGFFLNKSGCNSLGGAEGLVAEPSRGPRFGIHATVGASFDCVITCPKSRRRHSSVPVSFAFDQSRRY